MGVQTILSTKLVATLRVVGVSDHVTRTRCADLRGRGIECQGQSGVPAGGGAGGDPGSALAVLGAVPAAFASATTALVDAQWVADLTEFFKFTTCWPTDE